MPRRTQVLHQQAYFYFTYGDFTLSVRLSQNLSVIKIANLSDLRRCSPTTPLKGLDSSNFARHYFQNLTFDFFSLSYLDGSLHSVSPCSPILFKLAMLVSLLTGYPIRLFPYHRMCAPTRNFSQLTTAFFAS